VTCQPAVPRRPLLNDGLFKPPLGLTAGMLASLLKMAKLD
jgi:hypothetical protein